MNPMAHHNQAWSWDPSIMNTNNMYNNYHQYHYPNGENKQVVQYDQREHLFEKTLTPSDVGKLNRLVIPKQHAEKYFPLDGNDGDKGLLLGFEDENGKSWRFRYSYWTSSQSYVLTKGWSRFVKEKRLDAGDVVLFERLRSSVDRLFIGCRRRGVSNESPPPPTQSVNNSTTTMALSPAVYYTATTAMCAYPASPSTSSVCHGSSVQHEHSFVHAVDQRDEIGESEASVGAPGNNIKRLRLFGVNLECNLEPEPQQLTSMPVYYFGHNSGHYMPTN